MLTPIERCEELNLPAAGHASDTSARHFWHQVRCCWSRGRAASPDDATNDKDSDETGGLVALVVCFVGAQMLAPTYSLANAGCTIENYGEDVYITTPPDTNSSNGQYARIGISRGIGHRAIVVADRIGATAFVELNADDTPIGLLTLQKDLR